ncbi:hypothetical protein STEG23_020807 [Scotinomys teguina]
MTQKGDKCNHVWEDTIHQPYINHTSTIHQPYINHTSTIHQPYINHTSTIHQPYINHTSTIHQPYINHTSTIHQPYINHTSTIHQPYINHTSTIHQPYINHTSTINQPYINHTSKGLAPWLDETGNSFSMPCKVQLSMLLVDGKSTEEVMKETLKGGNRRFVYPVSGPTLESSTYVIFRSTRPQFLFRKEQASKRQQINRTKQNTVRLGKNLHTKAEQVIEEYTQTGSHSHMPRARKHKGPPNLTRVNVVYTPSPTHVEIENLRQALMSTPLTCTYVFTILDFKNQSCKVTSLETTPSNLKVNLH